MLSCAVYTTIMKYTAPKFFKYRPVKRSEMINLFLVSLIFIVNIILSNSSLKYNSLALDQVLFDSNHLFVDVPLCHASFHLYFGIHYSWYSSSSRYLFISYSCYYWYNAGLCRRCLWHFLWNCLVSHQLHRFFSQRNHNEVSSLRKRTSEYVPPSEHRLFSLIR